MLSDLGDRTGDQAVRVPGLDHVQHTASGRQHWENGDHSIDCEPRRRRGRLHCPGCQSTWAKDRLISILAPMSNYRGRVAMITITAPGADVLPWGCAADDHPHSGKLGCRVDPVHARSWNDSAPWRWALMWQALRNDLRRSGILVLVKVWEPQQRGVAHLHLIVPLEHHRAIVGWLRANGSDYGFGFADDGRGIKAGSTASSAGAYVASYIGTAGKVESVCDAISKGVIPSRSFFVSPRIADGCTMRYLRMKRRAWAVINHGAPVPMWATAMEWGRALEGAGWSSSAMDPPT